jgi:hypothetical protein
MSMSETPQTPPPSEPPPPAGAGRPAGGYNADQMKASIQSANPYDLGVIAAGVLAFIGSLLPYYTVHLGGLSDSETAWHGFFGWFAAILALAGSAILAAVLFAKVTLPFPTRLTVLGLYAAALLCVIIAGLTWPGAPSGSGDLTGHGFGYWLSLIVILAGAGLSFMRMKADE